MQAGLGAGGWVAGRMGCGKDGLRVDWNAGGLDAGGLGVGLGCERTGV